MCLPSAEDTDVTALYRDYLIKSIDRVVKDKQLTSHDPIQSSHDATRSHDPEISLDPHDMDTLMASLSVFDTTHLGRLGTAVSMETSMKCI